MKNIADPRRFENLKQFNLKELKILQINTNISFALTNKSLQKPSYLLQRLKVQTFVVFDESWGNHAACFDQLILMENVRNAHLITHTKGF